MGIPLLTHRGRGIGTICILNKKPRSYSKQDLELLSMFAQRVTLAIEGKEIEDALKETTKKLKEIDRLFTLKNDISSKYPGLKSPTLITPVRDTIVNATRCELRVTGCGSKKIEERSTKQIQVLV